MNILQQVAQHLAEIPYDPADESAVTHSSVPCVGLLLVLFLVIREGDGDLLL